MFYISDIKERETITKSDKYLSFIMSDEYREIFVSKYVDIWIGKGYKSDGFEILD